MHRKERSNHHVYPRHYRALSGRLSGRRIHRHAMGSLMRLSLQRRTISDLYPHEAEPNMCVNCNGCKRLITMYGDPTQRTYADLDSPWSYYCEDCRNLFVDEWWAEQAAIRDSIIAAYDQPMD